MDKSEQIEIKLEFDKSVKYLNSKEKELTVDECLQEIGHLRMFIYNLGYKENNKWRWQIF